MSDDIAVSIKKPPFRTEFGGYDIVERDGYLYCIEKNVKILTNLFIQSKVELNTLPLGEKLPVGITIVGSTIVYMWRDDFNIHIECLKEPKTSFNKKYQELVKHLNSK